MDSGRPTELPAEPSARIFDIQSFSVHDGPGCRTTVFFAGCPLRCGWCSNPESHIGGKRLMFSEGSCDWKRGCSACRDACASGAISFREDGRPVIDRAKCGSCADIVCAASCAAHALKQPIRTVGVDALMEILLRDADSWGHGGGVTFSGGEPLLQHGFLDEAIGRCRRAGIHVAVETSGFAEWPAFRKTMAKVDFAFIDVKNMDDSLHRSGTGVSNAPILDNIARLAAMPGRGRIVLRQPTVHGYNDSDENASRLIAFMKSCGLFELNLLKFHRLGQTKWEQLGMEYAYRDRGDMDDARMERLQEMFLDEGIACYVGDDTPF